MTSPYRDEQPYDDGEPMPGFDDGAKKYEKPVVYALAAIGLASVPLLFLTGGDTRFGILWLITFPYLLAAGITAFEPAFRRWLAVRDARRVIRGIAALEARAAALDAPVNAGRDPSAASETRRIRQPA